MTYKIKLDKNLDYAELSSIFYLLRSKLAKHGFRIMDFNVEEKEDSDLINKEEIKYKHPENLNYISGIISFEMNGKFAKLLPEFKQIVIETVQEETECKVLDVMIQDSHVVRDEDFVSIP